MSTPRMRTSIPRRRLIALLTGAAGVYLTACAQPAPTPTPAPAAPPPPATPTAAPSPTAAPKPAAPTPTAAPKPAAPTPTAIPKPAAPSVPAKISWYSPAWGKAHQEVNRTLESEFNQKYNEKGIQLQYVQGSWDEMDNYMRTSSAAGTVTDVIQSGRDSGQKWMAANLVIDLKPYASEEWLKAYDAAHWTIHQVQGKQAMWPIYIEQVMMLYNTKMFSAAGVVAPEPGKAWTYDEFLAAAKQLTKAPQVWGFVPLFDPDHAWEYTEAFYLPGTNGKHFLQQSGDAWAAKFDPAGLEGIKLLRQTLEAKVAPPESMGLTGEAQIKAFALEKYAVILRANWAAALVRQEKPTLEFGMMSIPTPNFYYSTWAPEAFVITKGSKSPDAAAEVLYFLNAPAQAARQAAGINLLPVHKKALDEKIVADNPDYKVPIALSRTQKNLALPFNLQQGEFVDKVYAPAFIDYLNGRLPLEQVTARIEKEGPPILNRG